MGLIRIRTGAEQVAEHLSHEIRIGRWKESIPGIHQLADELGVNHKTVKNALTILENEGLVIPQGAGKRRKIDRSGKAMTERQLRICILAADPDTKQRDYMLNLHHELVEAGHHAFFAPGSLEEMRMNLKRVIRLVDQIEADAWLVSAGPRDILEWFAHQDLPAFALFGRRGGLPIASIGPDHLTATTEMTQRLIELGHRRIVLLCRVGRRLPIPGASERVFLDTLKAGGIEPSAYHLPDWEETPEGLHHCLESLFQVTPPTALIMDEPPFLVGALQFLGRHHIRVPEDVSLISNDPDASYEWCHPSVAHVQWDSRPWVRRVVRWAANVSKGKDDRRQSVTKSGFFEGGTVGPVGQHPVVLRNPSGSPATELNTR